jgi:amidohydrolase
MNIIEEIRSYLGELSAIRRDLHANPELGFEVERTARIVIRFLEGLGIEVHEGVGGLGIVGVIRKGNGSRAIGLRADMDALPIQEENDFSHKSQVAQRMHACGHDGHVAFLLGAARYLAQHGTFDGTVNLIFQPAEEVFGGADAMLKDHLFDRFPCDSVYAVHNRPGLAVGKFAIRQGAMMAGGASFSIRVEGRGSHGARPEASIDPVLTAAHIAVALQSIVSRNISPLESAVVSVTQISGSNAFNVIPQFATLGGTVRAFSREMMDSIEGRIRQIAAAIAQGFGAAAQVDFKWLVPPLTNDAAETGELAAAAADLVGASNVTTNYPLIMASEDFSFMLKERPGAFMNVGIAQDAAGHVLLHTPRYDFNDAAIPYGAGLFVRIAERKLPAGPISTRGALSS